MGETSWRARGPGLPSAGGPQAPAAAAAAAGAGADATHGTGAAATVTTPRVVAASTAAVALAALSICCTVGAVVLHAYVAHRTTERVDLLPDSLVLATAYPLVAVLVLLHQPRNRVGWVLLTTAMTGPYLLASQYAALALVPGGDGLPLQGLATWFSIWGWISYHLLWGLVPLLFPDGRLPSPRWRGVAAAIIGLTAVVLVASMVSPTTSDVSDRLPNPYGLDGAAWIRYITMPGAIAIIFGGGLAGLVAVVVRLRRSTGLERTRQQWLVAGVAGLLGATVTGTLVGRGDDAGYGMGIGMVLLVAAIGIGAVRHQLFDIGTALSRTLVYGLLTAFLLLAYAATITGAGALVPGQRVAYAVLAVVALVAAAARDQVQRLVDRMLFGSTRDPYAVLAALGGRLDLATGPMDALSQLADGVRDALKVPFVAVHSTDERLAAVETGTPVAAVERLPVPARTGSGHSGTLVVGRRHPSDAFTGTERAMFDDVARRAGDLLDAAAAQHDLRRSRERLVVAREEERRRLRRDLHDGIGPQLAAMAMQLDTLAEGLDERADPAAALVALLRDRLRGTVRDIRHVVEDLRPPALDEGGLEVALAQVIAPFAPVVTLDLPGGLDTPGGPGAVLELVADGLDNRAIAARLFLAEKTVRNRVSAILAKLDVQTRAEAIVRARDAGLGSSRATRAE